MSLSIRGVGELLRRHGWSCRQSARRAVERDEAAVAGSQGNRMIRWSNGPRLSVDTYDRTRSDRRRLRTAGRELQLRFTGIRKAVTGSSWALQAGWSSARAQESTVEPPTPYHCGITAAMRQ
ncbi:winged helix-turn-helix domain-containing protein [Streptomyces sp. NPDC002599]|uniref:helix-turn-helix domain-containing protein n=1 Tax=Streptomyces sp. NPDC002599 TaxID=3154421 RepID=UPI0033268792